MRTNSKKVAVLMTCHNRKDKTVSSINSLFISLKAVYPLISATIFITDDGCTDGTSELIQSSFPNNEIVIIQGDGSLYWAGGMRLAWKAAIESNHIWDFFLLLNDDTILLPSSIVELIETHNYCISNNHKAGVYSGATHSSRNSNEVTYGGDIWCNKFRASRIRLSPNGRPQACDVINCNIALIPIEVINKIGGLYEKYRHAYSDYDYSIKAKRHGIPVLLAGHYCGICDNDHKPQSQILDDVCRMSMRQRIEYYKNPLHSSSDYILFTIRTSIWRLPYVLIGRCLNTCFPKLYKQLHT